MDDTNAEPSLRELLLQFDARHAVGCSQRQQNYYRMRPEYRPTWHREQRCTCGLDDILGQHDDRAQS